MTPTTIPYLTAQLGRAAARGWSRLDDNRSRTCLFNAAHIGGTGGEKALENKRRRRRVEEDERRNDSQRRDDYWQRDNQRQDDNKMKTSRRWWRQWWQDVDDKTPTTTRRRRDDERREIGNTTISHNEGILPPLTFVKPSPPPCCWGCDRVVVGYSGLLGPTLV